MPMPDSATNTVGIRDEGAEYLEGDRTEGKGKRRLRSFEGVTRYISGLSPRMSPGFYSNPLLHV